MNNGQALAARETVPRLAAILVVCAVAAVAIHAPTIFFDHIFDGVDLRTHFQRATQFYQILGEGTIYPRWLPADRFGMGQPEFLVVSPTYYYVTAALAAMGAPIWPSMKAAAVAATFAVGPLSYVLLRRHLDFPWALAGTIFTMTAPFMLFLFSHHAALPWHFSFPFMVLVIVLSLERRRPFLDAWLAVAVAALIFTHMLVAGMTLISLSALHLANLQRDGLKSSATTFCGWTLSCWLGIGVAMIYFLPAAAATPLRAGSTPEETLLYFNWRGTFILPVVTSHYWLPRWANVQWVVAAVPVLNTIVAASILYSTRAARDERWYTALKLVYASVAGLVLASELAYPLYASSEWLRYVDWAYRFLTAPTICSSLALFLALPSLSQPSSSRRPRLPRWSGALPIGFSLAIFASIGYQTVVQMDSPGLGPATMSGEIGQRNGQPRTAGPHWRAYARSGGLRNACERVGAVCEPLIEHAHEREWRIRAGAPAQVVLPMFAFPAWTTYLDDKEAASIIDPDTGLIAVDVTPGEHRVSVRWTGLPAEHTGARMSAGCMLFLLLVWLWQIRSRWRLARSAAADDAARPVQPR